MTTDVQSRTGAQQNADAEGRMISILDLGVALAKRMPLLVVSTLLFGAIGYGIAGSIPKSYTSLTNIQPHLDLDPERVSSTLKTAMRSSVILDELLKKYPETGSTHEQQQRQLASRIGGQLVWQPPTGDLVVAVSAKEPETARNLATDFITAWLESTKARGPRRELLKKEIQAAAVEDVLAQRFIDPESAKLHALATLPDLVVRVRNVEIAKAHLNGVDRGVVVSSPSLPNAPSHPRRTLIASLAALGGFSLGILFILVEIAYAAAMARPASANRLRLIRGFLMGWRK